MACRPILYLDLDGVLVDFVWGALEYHCHGRALRPHQVSWNLADDLSLDQEAFWAPLRERDFWAQLPWTGEGRTLVSQLEQLLPAERIVLLTAPCQGERGKGYAVGCVQGKIDWVCRELPHYQDRLVVARLKSLLAGPGKLLVDDHEGNVGSFQSEGGQAVLVPRPWNSRRDQTDALGRFAVNDVVRQVKDALADLARDQSLTQSTNESVLPEDPTDLLWGMDLEHAPEARKNTKESAMPEDPTDLDYQRLKYFFWFNVGDWQSRLQILVSLDLLPDTTRQPIPHTVENLALERARAAGKLHALWEAVMEHVPETRKKPNPFPVPQAE